MVLLRPVFIRNVDACAIYSFSSLLWRGGGSIERGVGEGVGSYLNFVLDGGVTVIHAN